MGLLNKILKKKDQIEESDDKVQKDQKVKEVKSEQDKGKIVKKTEPKEEEEKLTKTAKKNVKVLTSNAYKVLVSPLISEKATMVNKLNQYIFAVDYNANKSEIKKAVEVVYGVKPISVNTIKLKGKVVRFGRTVGKRKKWKKAMITLPKGKSIEIYEGI